MMTYMCVDMNSIRLQCWCVSRKSSRTAWDRRWAWDAESNWNMYLKKKLNHSAFMCKWCWLLVYIIICNKFITHFLLGSPSRAFIYFNFLEESSRCISSRVLLLIATRPASRCTCNRSVQNEWLVNYYRENFIEYYLCTWKVILLRRWFCRIS